MIESLDSISNRISIHNIVLDFISYIKTIRHKFGILQAINWYWTSYW